MRDWRKALKESNFTPSHSTCMCPESITYHSPLFLTEACFGNSGIFLYMMLTLCTIKIKGWLIASKEKCKPYNLEYKYTSLALVRLGTIYECWQNAVTQIGHHVLCLIFRVENISGITTSQKPSNLQMFISEFSCIIFLSDMETKSFKSQFIWQKCISLCPSTHIELLYCMLAFQFIISRHFHLPRNLAPCLLHISNYLATVNSSQSCCSSGIVDCWV